MSYIYPPGYAYGWNTSNPYLNPHGNRILTAPTLPSPAPVPYNVYHTFAGVPGAVPGFSNDQGIQGMIPFGITQPFGQNPNLNQSPPNSFHQLMSSVNQRKTEKLKTKTDLTDVITKQVSKINTAEATSGTSDSGCMLSDDTLEIKALNKSEDSNTIITGLTVLENSLEESLYISKG